ncbi:PEP-CTERM sorting domain-containing protein [Roseateles paludis]|jgi:hypothetical protein|uniref:PEP-CTERM sorting domain-containing protein n=1 Tax=Roseateles paludis TaxID=3145238 RepID=A0ABV0FYC0_9BURK
MRAVIISAAVLALVGSASAQVATAVAELKQLHFELIDLDPSDGISPSLTWASDKPLGYFAMATPLVLPGNSIVGGSAPLGGSLSDVAASDWPSTQLAVSISSGDLFTSGAGPTFRAEGMSTAGGSVFGGSSLDGVVTLSPHTRLQLSATVGTVALTNVGIGGFASATLQFCSAPAEGANPCLEPGSVDYSSAWVARQSGWVDTFLPGSLTLAWDNTTASAAQRYVAAGTYIQLDTTAPVPEPEQWLLFATGLGVIASRRLRR